jgi:hypothetical protein
MDTLTKPVATGTLAALCTASLLGLVGCAQQPGGLSELSGPIKTGVAYFELECQDPELLIGEVDYEITGTGVPRIRGVMARIPGTMKVSATVSMPTGTDYTVLVSALIDSGNTDCRTSSLFDILDSQSTKLELTLQCDELMPGDPGAGDAGSSTDPDAVLDAGDDSTLADCGPDATTDDVNVIPSGKVVVVIEPGAAKDAAVPAASGVDAGASGAAKETCAACSERMCGESQGSLVWSDCYLSTDKVDAGPAAGSSKAQTCAAVLTCAHNNHCASANVDSCYCGEGTSVASCLTRGANGPCRGAWEAAGETTTPSDLLRENAVWQDSALGVAVRLLTCEAASCPAACSTSK